MSSSTATEPPEFWGILYVDRFAQCGCGSNVKSNQHWALFLAEFGNPNGQIFHVNYSFNPTVSRMLRKTSGYKSGLLTNNFVPSHSKSLVGHSPVASEIRSVDVLAAFQEVDRTYSYNIWANNCQNQVILVLEKLYALRKISTEQLTSIKERVRGSAFTTYRGW